MARNVDLKKILDQWPYDPEDDVRLVLLPDGRQVMQVRQPLGIEQYELEGRPDGLRPYGMESALAYQQSRLKTLDEQACADTFTLTSEECKELFDEGMLYYCRYVQLFQIQEWDLTVRDTTRSLELFDFVRAHAGDEESRVYLEQWRPYVLRIHAISRAMQALAAERHDDAMNILQESATAIERLPDSTEETFQLERQRSMEALREIIAHVRATRPHSEIEHLERELKRAIDTEQYENAAKLRDRLRRLRP